MESIEKIATYKILMFVTVPMTTLGGCNLDAYAVITDISRNVAQELLELWMGKFSSHEKAHWRSCDVRCRLPPD